MDDFMIVFQNLFCARMNQFILASVVSGLRFFVAQNSLSCWLFPGLYSRGGYVSLCNCISVTPLIMPPETPALLRSHIAIKNYKEFPERSIWSGPICNNVACLHRGRHGLWAPGKATLSLTLTFKTKTCQ